MVARGIRTHVKKRLKMDTYILFNGLERMDVNGMKERVPVLQKMVISTYFNGLAKMVSMG